jgi:hypothetical protein
VTIFSLQLAAEDKTLVYPQINVWPNGVDVRIWNHTDQNLHCSGTIHITTQMNRYRTEFYNEYVPARRNSFRHLPNFFSQDPYRFGNHNIYCRPVR